MSTNFHKANNANSTHLTHAFTIFAQFLDHDLTFTPEMEFEGDCCSAEGVFHPSCMAMVVPEFDDFFGVNKPFGGPFATSRASSPVSSESKPVPNTLL